MGKHFPALGKLVTPSPPSVSQPHRCANLRSRIKADLNEAEYEEVVKKWLRILLNARI
jgi:hypothetical protein